MKAIRSARIVVVASSDQASILAVALRRMNVASVTSTAEIGEAKRICQSSRADVCVVLADNIVPDEVPVADDAPGTMCGVPSLLLVPIVTPYVRKMARRRGYQAVLSTAVPARMLYRHIRAALQRRNRKLHGRPRMLARIGLPFLGPLDPPNVDKPTLH
jgi:hypothetical protein